MMAEFGMDFMYDNGSASLWNGSADLEPMYTAYQKQAAYCVAHGFQYANTSATRRQFVTQDILRRCIETWANEGLDTILWLWGGAELEWSINGRDLDPVFTCFHEMIQYLDTMPDIARTVKYICYAPEFDRLGTYEELESYLDWTFPMYRQWLSDTVNMQDVKLSAGMGSARLDNQPSKDVAQMIAIHTDIFGFSEYPLTDAGLQNELDVWESYDLLGTPILMQETNNATRMGQTQPPYAEDNHWGFLPYEWLAHWINHGAEIICLHRGNNSYSDWAQWFDMYGNPTAWLTDGGLVDAIANRHLYHGYLSVVFPVGWTLGQLIRARGILLQTGLQVHPNPSHITHARSVTNETILEGVFDPAVINAAGFKELLVQQMLLDPETVDLEVTTFALDEGWLTSGAACRAYIG